MMHPIDLQTQRRAAPKQIVIPDSTDDVLAAKQLHLYWYKVGKLCKRIQRLAPDAGIQFDPHNANAAIDALYKLSKHLHDSGDKFIACGYFQQAWNRRGQDTREFIQMADLLPIEAMGYENDFSFVDWAYPCIEQFMGMLEYIDEYSHIFDEEAEDEYADDDFYVVSTCALYGIEPHQLPSYYDLTWAAAWARNNYPAPFCYLVHVIEWMHASTPYSYLNGDSYMNGGFTVDWDTNFDDMRTGIDEAMAHWEIIHAGIGAYNWMPANKMAQLIIKMVRDYKRAQLAARVESGAPANHIPYIPMESA